MTDLTAAEGCDLCGLPERGHAQRWVEHVGWHPWIAPSIEKIQARMRARYEAKETTA